jgi:hypothetical protein
MSGSGVPEGALTALAALLRDEGTVISPHVAEPAAAPELGPLAAAGPRAAGDPAEYALVVEAVREGYLLHYGNPRIIARADPDLALLAGDYLYATGLARLAALGDLEAVRELSDLISLSAHIHGDGARGAETAKLAEALWRSSAHAVGYGSGEAHEAAKAAARDGDPGAVDALLESAESIGFSSRSTQSR